METGEIIKKLRLEHNLTQEQLGNILGVQKSAIAKYEKGRVENLKRSTIQKMATLFKVSPLVFLGMDELEKPNPCHECDVYDTCHDNGIYEAVKDNNSLNQVVQILEIIKKGK